MVLCASAAWPQDVSPAPVAGQPGSPKDQIALVYDNRKITDAERAQLIAYVSEAVPVDRWNTLTVPANTTVAGLIDDYYDLYAKEGQAYRQPISAQLLEIELRRGNPSLGTVVAADTEVRMPPVPVRAMGRYAVPRGAPETLRVFDAAQHAYGISTTQRRDELPVPSEVLLAKAVDMKPQRASSTTAILLDVEHVVAAKPVALPASVVVLSSRPSGTDGQLRTGAVIDLLQDDDRDCLDAFGAWEQSPYRALRERAIAGLSPSRLQEVLERASRRRLVILDTQVDIEHGHGFKVASVARQTLDRLGLPQMSAGLDVFDLLPSTPKAAQALRDALAEWRAAKPPNIPEDDFLAAGRWIDERAAQASGTWPVRFDMPDVLLQAVLQKLLVTGADDSDPARPRRTWVNMSFRIDSPALRAILKQFDPTKSLGFVAAGNEAGGVRSGYAPHDGASATSSFVLVTNGTRRGPIGSVGPSPDRVGPMVSLVAMGCGFPGLQESGSSFAAPHVAASAWLQSLLLDDESAADDVRGIVDALRVSSTPTPGFERTLSHGLFDPQQSLARPTAPHIVLANHVVESLRTFAFDVACRRPGGPEVEAYRSTTAPDASLRTFSLARNVDDTGWQLLVRTGGPSWQVRRCDVVSLRFEATTSSGHLGPMDLERFATEITSVTGHVP
jgi:hypothetical protein